MRAIAFVLAGLISILSAMAQHAIIPQPDTFTPDKGVFVLDARCQIEAAPAARAEAEKLRAMLRPATGFDLPIVSRAKGPAIALRLTSGKDRAKGHYRMSVRPGRIVVESQTAEGLFYAAQTMRQLLPADIFRKAPLGAATWSMPACTIEDAPRFAWRGAHLDVARHFQPKEFILKFLDLLAMHKLNVLHLHLTDDQGWRIQIKKYPKLTEVGAWRKDTMLTYSPPTFTGKPHGGFYTQDDLREFVAYAADRHITVVPEIEMPGHAQAAIAAYPELGDSPVPLEVWTRWGVNENVFNVKDSTIRFLQAVLTEVIDIFPSPFIHIGGDECPKSQWKQSAYAQEKMKRLGLKDEHELQSWFIRQMDRFLDGKGRRLIGWSEILEGGLAPGAALMVWLGDEGALTAVGSGHDVVMAQTSHTYFDYYQSQDRSKEPHAIGGFLPLEKVYAYNPVLPQMTAEQARHVLGCQFQLWSEYIPNPKHMEYMAFPRACALAEVAWTRPERKADFADFRTRLAIHLDRLSRLDVNSRPLGP